MSTVDNERRLSDKEILMKTLVRTNKSLGNQKPKIATIDCPKCGNLI